MRFCGQEAQGAFAGCLQKTEKAPGGREPFVSGDAGEPNTLNTKIRRKKQK